MSLDSREKNHLHPDLALLTWICHGFFLDPTVSNSHVWMQSNKIIHSSRPHPYAISWKPGITKPIGIFRMPRRRIPFRIAELTWRCESPGAGGKPLKVTWEPEDVSGGKHGKKYGNTLEKQTCKHGKKCKRHEKTYAKTSHGKTWETQNSQVLGSITSQGCTLRQFRDAFIGRIKGGILEQSF